MYIFIVYIHVYKSYKQYFDSVCSEPSLFQFFWMKIYYWPSEWLHDKMRSQWVEALCATIRWKLFTLLSTIVYTMYISFCSWIHIAFTSKDNNRSSFHFVLDPLMNPHNSILCLSIKSVVVRRQRRCPATTKFKVKNIRDISSESGINQMWILKKF